MGTRKIKFPFNEGKALAALAYVASERPGLTPFFVSKVFYLAEKAHVNKYGRPIVADTYIAMPEGPVPSTIKNYIDENWYWVSEPEARDAAFTVEKKGRGLPKLMPGRDSPNSGRLSETDRECLKEAIAFCEDKSKDEISDITHLHKAWANTDINQPIDYADFIDDDNPHKDEVLGMVRENAVYSVL
jgi:uncharacterized phage-associated protein